MLKSPLSTLTHFTKLYRQGIKFRQPRKLLILRQVATSPQYIQAPFDTIVDMQEQSCKLYHDKPLFGTRVGNAFEWMTYEEFSREVQLFRNVLKKHNITKNSKVGIISNNRVEWAVAMYAVASIGGQLVPM